jgi:hypothetical protein
MDRVFWKRAALTPIRVLLLPTDTFSFCSYGCSLHKLAKILNRAQKSYKFEIPVPEPKKSGSSQTRVGISLEKRRPLSNDNVRESAAKTTTERRVAVSTYLTSEDAADQCLQYAENILYRRKTEFLSESDIVVVVGGEVIVPDVTDNEFEGDAAQDAYSCISVIEYGLDGVINKTSDGIEILDYNDQLAPVQKACYVSLRRLPYIFPEIDFTDVPERARGIAARYIISNIIGFVGNRSFGVALSHDSMSGCLNESNWVGGERASYQIDDYCPKCKANYRLNSVRDAYRNHTTDELLASLSAIGRCSDNLDKIIRSDEKASLWFNIALVAVALNIFDAFIFDMVLAGFEGDWVPRSLHSELTIKPHVPAIVFALGVGLVGVLYLARYVWRRSTLP